MSLSPLESMVSRVGIEPNPQIKRTAGDRPPLSVRCVCLAISDNSLLIGPPVSTGGHALVCQLVCHPELGRRAATPGGAGDPLFGFRKDGTLVFKGCSDGDQDA